jgi:hypothetical protein
MKALIVATTYQNQDGRDVIGVPDAWSVRPEEDTGMMSVFHPSGAWVHAFWVETDAGHMTLEHDGVFYGVFWVCGDPTYLRWLKDRAQYAWTLPELRADNGAVATAIKTQWKASADGRPAVALRRTAAGRSYELDAENTLPGDVV